MTEEPKVPLDQDEVQKFEDMVLAHICAEVTSMKNDNVIRHRKFTLKSDGKTAKITIELTMKGTGSVMDPPYVIETGKPMMSMALKQLKKLEEQPGSDDDD